MDGALRGRRQGAVHLDTVVATDPDTIFAALTSFLVGCGGSVTEAEALLPWLLRSC